MSNPVLVEVTRGPLVESRHTGAFVVMDARGGIVASAGDIERPVFPRSAVKSFQALPLLETGAAANLGLTPAELALAISSHSGEPEHVATSAVMLAKAGRDETCLECGPHWPSGEAVSRAMVQRGEVPTSLHNNCSGKHAGFICLACEEGLDPTGYIQPGHKLQKMLAAAMSEMTGAVHDATNRGIDGCGIPTYAIPLRNLALGFARLATAQGLDADRAAATRTLRAAAAAHPFMVAGTGRFDTKAMTLLGPRIFTKTGAEGVYCAALPDQGLGIALKCDDGTTRASEAMMAALLARFVPMGADEELAFQKLREPTLRNWVGTEVGRIRAVGMAG